MENALDIHITGVVQGVGFRPFVYRCAKRNLIKGWVLNAVDGVHIRAQGEEKLVDAFVMDIVNEAPDAANVHELNLKEVPLEDFEGFEIRFSEDAAVERTTLVSPDLATCEDCARELFEPEDRRFRYPFINCTNCGPRFTIINELPYDRPATSMKDFAMCPECAREYANPEDRRFHAQPDACFDCGPVLTWYEIGAQAEGQTDAQGSEEGAKEAKTAGQLVASETASTDGISPDKRPVSAQLTGATREESDAILARGVELLQAGKILAVKGLGGFHLVCDAENPEAVAELRRRKHRNGKAFAVMVPSVEVAAEYCLVSTEEAETLKSAAHPIVLLRKRQDAAAKPVSAGLADGLAELGVMLPYTPVQHLLMHDFAEAGGTMLVMTSGNVHDEPIQTDDEEARVALAGIVDAFLGNNRAICARYDDSVVRVIDAAGQAAIQVIRRARGFAPMPLSLPALGEGEAPAILAVGPEQKNTFCLSRGGEAFVSQHIGDLENAQTFDAWLEAKDRFTALFRVEPEAYVCDYHPEYLSTKWAKEASTKEEKPLCEVQHHHAHIVSALAEHGQAGPVCGIAFDGTGYGMDGGIWGGEVLLANLSDFERFANFAYVPMPGGAAAVKNPLRMAFGVLYAYDLLEHPGAEAALAEIAESAPLLTRMIEQGINTPFTSSVGRLFDAASALLGVCTHPTYEGEPAIMLEAALWEGLEAPAFASDPRYAIAVTKNTATATSTAQDTSVLLLDAHDTFAALLDDMVAGVDRAIIAKRFHDAFVEAIGTVAQLVDGLYGIRTVALSGGVFMNRYLLENALSELAKAGMSVLINKDLPPNDGCIAYGQATVARARLQTAN